MPRNFRIPVAITCLWVCYVLAWAQGPDIQVLPKVQEISFPAGYEVLDGESGNVLKKVDGPTSANAQAFVDVKGVRHWMSDWSLQRLREGKPHNWMRPIAPPPPAGRMPQPKGVIIFEQAIEMTFEHGFVVVDPQGITLKTVAGSHTAVIQAELEAPDSFGRKRYVTDWSWNRFMTRGIQPNLVIPIPEPYQMTKQEQAWELRDRGRFLEAIPIAREAVREAKSDDDRERALGELQTILFRLGRWQEAEGPTRELVERQPAQLPHTDDRGLERRSVELGWILENLGRREEALPFYDRAAERFGSVWFYDAARVRTAIQSAFLRYGDFVRLDRFLQNHPGEENRSWLDDAPRESDSEAIRILRRARKAEKDGDTKLALQEYAAYCAADFGTVVVDEYLKGAGLLWTHGEHDKATAALRRLPTLFSERKFFLPDLAAWSRWMMRAGLRDEAVSFVGSLESEATLIGYAPLSLARAWIELGEMDQARASYRRALPHLEKLENPEEGGDFEHLDDQENYFGDMTEAYIEAGNADEATAFLKRRYGNLEAIDPALPAIVHESIRKAALFSTDEALRKTFLERAISENRHRVERVVTKYPEDRRLEALEKYRPLDLPFTSGNARLAADAVLQFKGIVLDSLAREQARLRQLALTDAQKDQREEWNSLRSALIQEELNGTPANLLASLTQKIEDLEGEIFGRSDAARTAIDLEAITASRVQQALPEGSGLVEFVLYRHLTGFRSSEDRYAAVILRTDHEPVLVPIADAESMDTLVAEHRRIIEKEVPPIAGEVALPSEREQTEKRFETITSALYKNLWAPLEPHLSGLDRLFVSLDGSLHFCPLASLANPEGVFLAERWKLRQVGSGRDLLFAPADTNPIEKFAWLLGNPNFAGDSETTEDDPSSEWGEVLQSQIRRAVNSDRLAQRVVPVSVPLTPLAGTRQEVGALQTLFEEAGYRVEVVSEMAATEAALDFATSPSIAHLATHGVFLPAFEISSGSGKQVQNPMARSFLTLAGADHTIEAWNRGEIPNPETDGLLMAAEAAALPLENTEIVVLSACQTGLGESLRGEGVFGLKRALRQAGAKNVLTTLWNIADAETVELITDFYERYLEGASPGDALAQAQADMLRRYADEKGNAVATYFAGPFVLDVTGID